MLRLGELFDRAVVDMDAAEKVGHVHEVVLDPDRCAVAGLVIVHGKTLLSAGTERVIPSSSVYAVGTDAVTVSGAASADNMAALPRRRDVVGRKVVGRGGDLFGHIADVLIDPADGRIIGYELGDAHAVGALESVFGSPRPQQRRYVRAEADLKVGSDLVVVPDDAVVTQEVDDVDVLSQVVSSEGTGWGRTSVPALGRGAWGAPEARTPDPGAPVLTEQLSPPSYQPSDSAPLLNREIR